jgi:MoxR-like ATPase
VTTPVALGPRTCETCPAFLKPAQQNAVMGTNVGGDICGLRLIAIGRPRQDAAKPVTQITAEKCGSYGAARPDYDSGRARSAPIKLQVAMPTPQGVQRDPDRVTSCRSCANFVPSTEMARETGWNSGFCRASGELIFEDRLAEYPKTCETRTFALTTAHSSARGLILLPEFQDGYGRRSIASLLKGRATDPQLIETEAPVSAAAAAHGVRAFRLVSDPEGYGPDIKLPIFATDFFDPDSRAKVPRPGDQERPEDYLDHGGFVYKVAALWMELDEVPAVWGPSGVGKTELFRHMAFLMGLPFERISITPSSEIDDLAGKPGFSPERGTFFTYGRVPRAWGRANVIDVDEPNSGPPDVWMFFRPLTDNSKQLVLDQNEGERLERHTSCYLGFAMNPAWDPRNTGVVSLADADGSRLMHIFMDIPPADIERAIIRKALERDGWEDAKIVKAVDLVMSCATDLRTLSEDTVIPVSWGLRSQIQAARAMRYFSPVTAYRLAVADSLEPTAQQAILDVVKSKFEG